MTLRCTTIPGLVTKGWAVLKIFSGQSQTHGQTNRQTDMAIPAYPTPLTLLPWIYKQKQIPGGKNIYFKWWKRHNNKEKNQHNRNGAFYLKQTQNWSKSIHRFFCLGASGCASSPCRASNSGSPSSAPSTTSAGKETLGSGPRAPVELGTPWGSWAAGESFGSPERPAPTQGHGDTVNGEAASNSGC